MPSQLLRKKRLARAAGRAAQAPSIVDEANDLQEIKKSVEDAATVAGGIWFSYTFVLFYFAVAAAAVTHTDLLLENSVKLPFLNVELPLRAFFAVAPFLFLITHAYALVNFKILERKTLLFQTELDRQSPNTQDQEGLKFQLPSSVFVQILAGPRALNGGIFGMSLRLIAWLTLVAFPILLLLLFQIQFLPYHDWVISRAQRIALIIDVVLILTLHPLYRRDRWMPVGVLTQRLGLLLTISLLFAALWLSIVIATFPGEQEYTALAALPQTQPVRELLFDGAVDSTTRRRTSWFSNTLVLPGFNLYEALKIDDRDKVAWKDHLIDLRGRFLERAVLYGAILSKADLTGAHLDYAALGGAQLEGALLDDAQLKDASLHGAHLQGASLNRTKLQGALLDTANLAGASLKGAQLQGASFTLADLQGSTLDGAQLQGAMLMEAQLEGASLKYAWLLGAWLELAKLQGASLHKAQLLGACLNQANIRATDFSNSEVWRLELEKAEGDKNAAPIEEEEVKWVPETRDDTYEQWTESSYYALRRTLEELRKGDPRGEGQYDKALSRIDRLDCKNSSLTTCDYGSAYLEHPDAVARLEEFAQGNDAGYEKGLANTLQELVCAAGVNQIYVLRGMMDNGRLCALGNEISGFASAIESPRCLISLKPDDRARLHAFEEDKRQCEQQR